MDDSQDEILRSLTPSQFEEQMRILYRVYNITPNSKISNNSSDMDDKIVDGSSENSCSSSKRSAEHFEGESSRNESQNNDSVENQENDRVPKTKRQKLTLTKKEIRKYFEI